MKLTKDEARIIVEALTEYEEQKWQEISKKDNDAIFKLINKIERN